VRDEKMNEGEEEEKKREFGDAEVHRKTISPRSVPLRGTVTRRGVQRGRGKKKEERRGKVERNQSYSTYYLRVEGGGKRRSTRRS